MKFVHIVATDLQGAIGVGGDLPWKCSKDLRLFKNMTTSYPLILGRKTFDSFGGRPLPGRDHFILSRKKLSGLPDRCFGVQSLDEAYQLASACSQKKLLTRVYIIGGAEIYAQSLDVVSEVRLSRFEITLDKADAFYPLKELESKFKRVSSYQLPIELRKVEEDAIQTTMNVETWLS